MKHGKRMKVDQHILVRYFLGQASEEEKGAIHQWIEQDEANRKQFIRERIRFDASVLVEKPVLQKKKRFQLSPAVSWSLRIAASLLFLVGSFYLYDGYRMEQLSNVYQSIQVPAGNRTHIILPDGTSVWLNANTSLRYPLIFGGENREIQLDGEAYLEVKKDKKPFIVKTEKYDIEVLGTVFDVEAYSGKSQFRASLYEGQIKLYNSQQPKDVFLSPGQTAELEESVIRVFPTKDRNAYRWKDGLIYIEDKSFESIMELFEKFYDVEIVVNNQDVKDLGYRGKLRVSDGVDHALRVLQNDFPFKYERDEENNVIYIN